MTSSDDTRTSWRQERCGLSPNLANANLPKGSGEGLGQPRPPRAGNRDSVDISTTLVGAATALADMVRERAPVAPVNTPIEQPFKIAMPHRRSLDAFRRQSRPGLRVRLSGRYDLPGRVRRNRSGASDLHNRPFPRRRGLSNRPFPMAKPPDLPPRRFASHGFRSP